MLAKLVANPTDETHGLCLPVFAQRWQGPGGSCLLANISCCVVQKAEEVLYAVGTRHWRGHLILGQGVSELCLCRNLLTEHTGGPDSVTPFC